MDCSRFGSSFQNLITYKSFQQEFLQEHCKCQRETSFESILIDF